jgi:hypothetical protein
MGDARLGAMREAEDAVRAMHEYGLDASYSIRQRLMTILNEVRTYPVSKNVTLRRLGTRCRTSHPRHS